MSPIMARVQALIDARPQSSGDQAAEQTESGCPLVLPPNEIVSRSQKPHPAISTRSARCDPKSEPVPQGSSHACQCVSVGLPNPAGSSSAPLSSAGTPYSSADGTGMDSAASTPHPL